MNMILPFGIQVVLTLYSTNPEAFSSLHHRLLSAAASFVQSKGSQRHVWAERSDAGRTSQVPWRHGAGRSRDPDGWNGLRQSGPGQTSPEAVRARRIERCHGASRSRANSSESLGFSRAIQRGRST